jgi:hypothetical protein
MQHMVRAFTLANRARVPEHPRPRDARAETARETAARDVKPRLRLPQVFARRVRRLA